MSGPLAGVHIHLRSAMPVHNAIKHVCMCVIITADHTFCVLYDFCKR